MCASQRARNSIPFLRATQQVAFISVVAENETFHTVLIARRHERSTINFTNASGIAVASSESFCHRKPKDLALDLEIESLVLLSLIS